MSRTGRLPAMSTNLKTSEGKDVISQAMEKRLSQEGENNRDILELITEIRQHHAGMATLKKAVTETMENRLDIDNYTRSEDMEEDGMQKTYITLSAFSDKMITRGEIFDEDCSLQMTVKQNEEQARKDKMM